MRTRLIVAFITVALLAAVAANWFNNLILPFYGLPSWLPGWVTSPPFLRHMLYKQYRGTMPHPTPGAVIFYMMAVIGLLLAVLTAVAAVASRRVLRLAQAAQQMSDGDLSVRIEPKGHDELAQLTITFNEMAAALEDKIGQTLTGGTAQLPAAAPGMIGRLPGVTQVQDTGVVTNVNAFRSPLIPATDTNALTVTATSLGLPATVGTSVAHGSYLNPATARAPVAVLGAAAAQRLGIDKIFPGERIWAGGMWFYITGILKPATLAPEIDSSILVGYPQHRDTCASTATPPTFTCGPPPMPSTASTTCSPRRPTRGTLTKSTSLSPPPRSLPRPRPRARSTPCFSAWARSPCW